MGEIIPFVSKSQDGGADCYVFYYQRQSYAMMLKEVEGGPDKVSYGKAEFAGKQLEVSKLDEETDRLLFDKTYGSFFFDVREAGDPEGEIFRCALLVHFEFEEESYGVYYEVEDSEAPMMLLHLQKEGASMIRDELRRRRVVKHFEENYTVR